MTVADWLRERGAHHDVVEWATPFENDLARLWAECPRGDWLLGIAARAEVDSRALVRAARACVELARDQAPDDDPRIAAALSATDRWLSGSDDPEARARAKADVEKAADEAPDPATQAAALAALATIGAVDAPDEAAAAVSFVVQAAVLDVGECAVMSALRYTQATCAERVREHVPFEAIRDLVGSLTQTVPS